MKTTQYILIAIGMLISLIIVYSFASEKKPNHLSINNCSECHLAQNTIDNSNSHFLVDSQEKLCGTCHESSIQNSHPSGFVPSDKIELPFVVDWKGEITCSTCHFIHEDIGKMNRSEKVGKDYCLECHGYDFFEDMRDKGISLIGFGHLDARQESDFNLIDKFSMQCIACHNKLEGILNVSLSSNTLLQHNGSGGSHPIGKDYLEASKYGGYVSINNINPLIELPDGKVGCTSCHEGYSKNHARLVISMAGSNLCMECHDL